VACRLDITARRGSAMQSTKNNNQITVRGTIKRGKLAVSGKIALPDGEVRVTVSAPQFKGRRVYTVEEVARMDSPYPDESEWVAEIRRGRRTRKK
jgi:hypothetical protein